MQRSQKQLIIEANFGNFFNLIPLILGKKSFKGLKLTKIVQEITFEVVWAEIQPKKGFQRQSFTKYLRLTLFFMSDSALRLKFNF